MSQDPSLPSEDIIFRLRRSLIIELSKAMALPQTESVRKILELALGRAVRRVSDIFWQLDQEVEQNGTASAARWLLNRMVTRYTARGVEEIPPEGPLLIASNHPAAYDSIVISAFVKRPDYKIIIGNIPPFYLLPNLCQHAIFSPDDSDTFGRMKTVRSAIQHLKQGGALLIFPRGGIEPDPDCMPNPDEEFYRWSRSVEVFLRHVPQTQLLITIVSGVIAPAAMHHPLTWLRKERRDRQRLAFMIQIIRQVLSGKDVFGLIPRVTFGELLSGTTHELVLAEIERAARSTLATHMASG
jgi:hypothetical protein